MVPLCNIWKSANTTTDVNGRALFQSYISKLFNEEVGWRYSCTAYRENGKNGTKYLLGGNAPHHWGECPPPYSTLLGEGEKGLLCEPEYELRLRSRQEVKRRRKCNVNKWYDCLHHCLLLLFSQPSSKNVLFSFFFRCGLISVIPVSYTHLTLPTTPYV